MIEITFEPNERSTAVVTASFVDEASQAIIPNFIYWKLTDLNGIVINNREAEVISPNSTVQFVLSGLDLVIRRKGDTKRLLFIYGNYDSDLDPNPLPIVEEFIFEITDIENICGTETFPPP